MDRRPIRHKNLLPVEETGELITVIELDPFFLWIARHFHPEAYLISSKIQGLLWSAADVVLVAAVLKIAGLARRGKGRRRILVRYILLAGSALLTPLLLFTRTPRDFFLLECLICGSQFAILIYTAVLERSGILDLLLKTMQEGAGLAAPRQATKRCDPAAPTSGC